MDDSPTVHTVPVTPDSAPDPVAAAVAALIEHDATCGYCADHSPNDLPCQDRLLLVAARRRALTGRADPPAEMAKAEG